MSLRRANSALALLLLAALGVSSAAGCGSKSPDNVDPSDAGTDTGLGADSGDASAPSWSQRDLDQSIVPSIAIDPKNPDLAYLSVSAGSKEKGFFRSKDNGRTWSKIAGGLPEQYGGQVVVHAQLGTVLAVPGVEGIWRSTNGGDSWTVSTGGPGNVTGLLFHPTQNKAWAVTSQEGSIRSGDGGASWVKPTNMNLPLNQFGLGPLAFDGTKLYLGTDGHGLYSSTDDGDTWTAESSTGLSRSGAQGQVLDIQATASRPGVVFVQTNAGGIYLTIDGAKTFSKLDTSPETTRYAALRIDPKDGKTVYVSVNENQSGAGGLLKTTDDGATWAPFGPGAQPNTVPVGAVDVGTDGTVLAGTIGRGVWRYGR